MPEITEKLLDSINETAKIARTSLLFFLVVALYLLIIVGTTTDLMLLRGEIVTLPLMEVGVPVVAFYIVAPLIFLLLHINLLLRLSQLTETVSQWTETVSRWKKNPDGLKGAHNSLVFPVDFARLLLDGKPRWGLWVVVVTQIYILPIVVLLALQMSFLAYQDSSITFWHQLIVTADLVLLFLFVCFVRGTREKRKVERNYVLKMLFRMWGTVFSAGLVLIFTWAIAVVPNSGQETVGMNTDNFYSAVDGSQKRPIQQQLLACLRQLSACVFADWWEGYPIISYRPVRRFLNVAEQPVALTEIPPEIVGALIIKKAKLKGEEAKLKGEEAKLKGEEAKLKGEEAKLKDEEAKLKDEEAKLKDEEAKLKGEEAKSDSLCKYIGELDLSRRQLNYALFYGSQFRCVKLEFAELHGANLSEAKLNGADLRLAKLHGANLSEAELHGANLSSAELHGADLSGAELHGANLFNAELHGADLSEAELHGADLYNAELYGADLYNAELHGVGLEEAELYGANLSKAELHGADLSEAELYGADLSETGLHGANLGQAILENTDLSDAYWDKPEDWDNIISGIRVSLKKRISSIRDFLKKRGVADDKIDLLVSQIKEIESTGFSFVPPTTPIATDCVFHSEQGPFQEWPTPAEGCYSKFVSAVVKIACHNQWIAKGIVNRVTYRRAMHRKKAINLITALLDENCPSLEPHRKALNDRYKEFIQ